LENHDNDKDDPIGMGFPLKLAERLVRLHNEAIDEAMKEE